MNTETVPLDRLARVYRKIRDKIQVLTQEYETQVEELKAQQQEISNAMKDILMSTGQKSASTNEGTIILGTKTRYTTHDWDSFKQFVLEHEVLDLFEKRIAQSNMKQFLEENPTLVPPGLDTATEYTITVRKPSK
jgi:hypothetical protein